jgi:hypothetical protein
MYLVAPGGSVLGFNGRQFKQGEEIVPGKDFPLKNAADLVKTGFLRQVGGGAPAPAPVTRPAGVPEVPVMKRETEDKDSAPAIEVTKNKEAEEVAKAAVQEVRAANKAKAADLPTTKLDHKAASSPWVLNPASLAAKSLVELNVMIHERQKGAPSFETVEEAAAFLSQDFQAKA